MQYKKTKFGIKDADGYYKALIEQIGTSKEYDMLDISNRRRDMWVFSLFNGYSQLGQFKAKKPHKFREGDLVIVKRDKGKIVEVKKDKVTVTNIRDIFVD